jgi:hypothetical protein
MVAADPAHRRVVDSARALTHLQVRSRCGLVDALR